MSCEPEYLTRTFTVPNPDVLLKLPSRITLKMFGFLGFWVKYPSPGLSKFINTIFKCIFGKKITLIYLTSLVILKNIATVFWHKYTCRILRQKVFKIPGFMWVL